MEHAFNIGFLIGVTIYRYRLYGSAAAGASLLGLTMLITFGSTLPWYILIPMAIWLGIITSGRPEPKI
jgi:hypothetical protein